MYGLLWAVAAVELQRHRPAVWWRWFPTWPVYALSAVVAVATLPWQPVSWHANKPPDPVNFQLRRGATGREARQRDRGQQQHPGQRDLGV
jgi:hypothetical protein